MKNKRAVSALVATVLLILITVAGISIIWGAVMPMITKALQLGQTCMDARLSIDNLHGYTCYDENNKYASVMVTRDVEDYELVGMQIGLASASGTNSYEIREYQSILENGDFSMWSAGPTSPPDYWSPAGAGATFGREETITKIGLYSARSTTAAEGAALTQFLPDYADYIGKTVTLGCWVKPSHDNVFLRIGDGFNSTDSFVKPGNTDWQWMTVNHTVSSTAISLSFGLKNEMAGGYVVYWDGCVAGEGTEVEVWEKNRIFGDMPKVNEAKTYTIASQAEITEVTVAPILRVGNTEKVCGVTSRVAMPGCIKLE